MFAKSRDLYFIELGQCIVSTLDERRQTSKGQKKLETGDIFGEVAFLYATGRTATVTSINYCTLAQIPEKDCELLMLKYDFLRSELNNRALHYDDE